MDQEINQVRLLLERTYLESNTQVIKKIEEELEIKSRNADFIQIIGQCLLTQNSTNEFKQAAVNYIKIYVQKQLHEEQIEPVENKIKNLQIIYSLLKEKELEMKHKKNLVNSVITILHSDVGNQLKQWLFLQIQQDLRTSECEMIMGSLLGIQAVFQGSSSKKEIDSIIQQVLIRVEELIVKLIESILLQNRNHNSDRTVLIKETELMETCVMTLDIFIDKLKNYHGSALDIILNRTSIINIYYSLFIHPFVSTGIIISNLSLLNVNYSSCKFTIDMEALLNNIKLIVIKSLYSLSEYLLSKETKYIESCSLLTVNQQLMPLIQKELELVCSSREYIDKYSNNKECEQLLQQMLEYVGKWSESILMYQYFSDNKSSLLIRVILPLLTINQDEEDLFSQSPYDFVKLSLDCVDNQLINTLKSKACKLIEYLCDNIDGCSNMFCKIALEILSKSVDNQQIGNNKIYLENNEYHEWWNMQQNVVKIDTALMILSVMSYLIHQREDLLIRMQEVIGQYYERLITKQQHSIVRSRMCMMISYYYDNLFVKQQDFSNFKGLITYLISEAIDINNPQGITVMAIESLKGIFEFNEPKQQIIQFINDTLNSLLDNLRADSHLDYYDIILNIYDHYFQQINQDINLIHKTIFLLSQIVNSQLLNGFGNNKQKTNIVINKCFNILITISDKPIIIQNHLQIIKQLTQPFILLLAQIQLIDFEEYILIFVTNILKHSQLVCPYIFDILNHSQFLTNKHKSFVYQFNFINLFLEYANQEQKQNQADSLTNQAIFIIKNDDNSEQEKSIAGLILQLILQKIQLNDNQIKEILIIVTQCLSQASKQNTFTKILIGIINSAFLFYYNQSMKQLVELQLIDSIYSLILNTNQINSLYSDQYHRNLALLTLSKLISCQNMDYLTQQLNLFIALVQEENSKNESQNKQKNKLEIEDNEEDEDDEDEDYDDDDYEDDEDDDYILDNDSLDHEWKQQKYNGSKIQTNIINMKSIVYTQDIFNEFRNTFNYLKQNNNDKFLQKIYQLDQNNQVKLKDILQSYQIKLNNEQVVNRKILKIKPKTNLNQK